MPLNPDDLDTLELADRCQEALRSGDLIFFLRAAARRLRILDALTKAQTERIGAQSELLSRVAEEKMLTTEQVADMLVVSVRTVWRLVEAGNFPPPVRFNRKLVRWRLSDVRKAINEAGS